MGNLSQRTSQLANSETFEKFKKSILEKSKLGGKLFILDAFNDKLIKLLFSYFNESIDDFFSLSHDLNVKDASLEKGILIVGNVGTGKTSLMKLFSANPRRNFQIINAKEIADNYEIGGLDGIWKYYRSEYGNPMSICVDDLGTEDIKNHMGNKRNVVGDIIENRYASGFMGLLFHATSNLTVQQMTDFYGLRIVSRLRETVNLVELGGPDRRK